ncbi:MAG TPA: TetR/AcrR family transcriptional regulator [Candidatus Scatomorpha pullicola]|nr:TetR/AcrR family transcriptional regulator [Candidatus Scatomorpha pullicola]
MPRASEELTSARKDEIINACAELYGTMGFREITIRDIGAKTSFTRTSIYNYFQTKEEIFLALLEREHRLWIADIEAMERENESMSVESFAGALSSTLEKRKIMLKLMSMNLYDMECNSRLENLVEFKHAYADAVVAIRRCLEKFFPRMTAADIREFELAFFPFLFGVYPYTSHSEKQKAAMELAGVEHEEYSVGKIVKDFAARVLGSF